VPERVHPELAQQQRSIAHQVLQPEQVTPERPGVVQVDVEGREVQERQVEVLGRRIVGVGDQAIGIDLLADVGQFPEEALDPPAPVPAHDVGRDLVGDAVGEDATVPAAAPGGPPHGLPRLRLRGRAFQETEVFGPGHIDQHLEAVFAGALEQPVGGHVVGADRVDGGSPHPGEVVAHLDRVGERLAPGVGGERAVGNAAHR
jgi:hypothetical protein